MFYLVPKQMYKAVSKVILAAFIITSVKLPAYAQLDPMPFMPKPGVRVPLSAEFTPAYLKGIVVHPENAFKFDFIIYRGDKELNQAQKRTEYTKLAKYFFGSLAIPDVDQWVNLSPYEKDRIIKEDFGKTEMGRDLLAQDYMLKQITASLIYPEDNLGKHFWNTVYTQAQEHFGTTNIPVNTFNKVWILPDDALIYEKGNSAYVLKNHLKVMLEEDYLSLQIHSGIATKFHPQRQPGDMFKSELLRTCPQAGCQPNNGLTLKAPQGIHPNALLPTHKLASQIVRQIVLPQLEREVNEGKNFAALRQVYSGMILAAWYKRVLKESLLGKIYVNKAKVKGVDQDPKTNEEIYRQYLKAYKKGVFNFIKEDVDKYTNETIPRKYFSGGAVDPYPAMISKAMTVRLTSIQNESMRTEMGTKDDLATVNAEPNAARLTERPLILVIGATGNQGGAVADALLRENKSRVRALVRNPQSPQAQRLAQRGVELVQGDLDDKESLRRAMQGVSNVFCATNFMGERGVRKGVPNPANYLKGLILKEEERGKRVALIAKEAGVKHFVYSGVPRDDRLLSTVSKAKVEDYIRALNEVDPEHPLNFTFIHPLAFYTNFSETPGFIVYPSFKAALGHQQLPMIAAKDIGKWAAHIFANANNYVGRTVDIESERLTYAQIDQTYEKVNGKNPIPRLLRGWIVNSLYRISATSIDLPWGRINPLGHIGRVLEYTREGKFSKEGKTLAAIGDRPTTFEAWLTTLNAAGEMKRKNFTASQLRDYTQHAQKLIPYTNLDEIISKYFDLNLFGDVNEFLLDVAQQMDIMDHAMSNTRVAPDRAMDNSPLVKGGIDFNAAQLSLRIKRDGNGIPVPVSQADWTNLSIEGLEPVITTIKSAAGLSIFSEIH